MADCQKLFEGFQQEISLNTGKKTRMKTSKKALRERIRKYFKDNHPTYVPKFFTQGSYKMGTVIRTKDDVCDVDDGVYFFRSPDVAATTLQGWVWDAVYGYTSTEPEHRKKCIRKTFANDYELDYPVYYKIDGQEYRLAVKNTGWEDSDPKAMIKWFNDKKDSNGLLINIVRDLKTWCDYKRNKMPSGLAMTILASNAKAHIVLNKREDISLRDILKEIKKALESNFSCIVPASPNDDLFENYDSARQENFMSALESFLKDAEVALREENELKASRLWRKHLGNRFPEGEDKVQSSNLSSFGIGLGAASSSPWGM